MKTSADTRRNRSGIELKPVYEPDDVPVGLPPLPGVEPYTRGIYHGMYREQLWAKRQLIGLETAESFNERQHDLLGRGQTAVNLTICNSTYRGLDVDQVPVELVGTCGTPLNCMEDIAIAFDGLPLQQLSIGINDPSPFTLAAMLLVHAERTGVSWADIRGTSNQSDILSHYVANHMFLRLPPRPGLRVLADHTVFMRRHVPGWNPISVVGQHMQQAGATPVQALAYTLCTAIEYVKAVCTTGLSVDDFGSRVTFFHDISMSFFEEVAKLRAQRSMWAEIMRERFGAQDERTVRFKTHAQTSGADLTRQEPLNNTVRVTIQALAAVLGGTQSLHTDAFDEALGTPTEAAASVALATQHIISDETGLPDVADPLGGSYYIEALTDEMRRRAWEIVAEVDRRGGMLAACEEGYIQAEIGQSALEHQTALAKGDLTVVGVNRYQSDDGAVDQVPVQRVSRERVNAQIARVKAARQNRDHGVARSAKERIADLATNTSDNAFEACIDGARAGLTHGELVASARDAFGFGQPAPMV